VVVAGSGDQPAGAVGNGIVSRGIVSATLGTSGVVFAHADEPTYDTGDGSSASGRVHTMCSAVAGKWCVFGCMLSAAGAFEWYRQVLGREEAREAKSRKMDVYEVLTRKAARVEPGSEGLFFMPYLTGERCPHPDPNARGGWVGLTSRHEEKHMIRAVLEGITYGMADALEIMRSMNITTRSVRLSGGGAKSAFWRQLQANVYNTRCVTVNAEEGPAYGAALLAGVGVGVWPSVPKACKQAIREVREIKPDRATAKQYRTMHATYQKLYPALAPLMGEMG